MRVKGEFEERSSDASTAEEQVKRLSSELSSLQDQLRREKDRVTQVRIRKYQDIFKNIRI